MKELKNWTEIGRGIYRYVIAAKAAYEIHILYHGSGTDILTAKASLYIVGDWTGKSGPSFFERECLLTEQPVFECILKAIADYKENNI